MSSPTQRSLKHLRDNGYVAEVVERWIPGANIRKDLFGFIDLVALKDGVTYGVQTTSSANLAARITKITESEYLPLLREAGWTILAHGWRKNAANKWVVREVDLS